MNKSFDVYGAGLNDPTVMSTEFEPLDSTMADGGLHTGLNESDLTSLLQGFGDGPYNDGDGSCNDIRPCLDRNQLVAAPEPLVDAYGHNSNRLMIDSQKQDEDSTSSTRSLLINTLRRVHPKLSNDDLDRIVRKAIADVGKIESNGRKKRKVSGTCDANEAEKDASDPSFVLPDDFTIHSDSILGGDDPSDEIGDVPAFCSVIDFIDTSSIATSKESIDDRYSTSTETGVYGCGRCGQVVKGHECPYKKKLTPVKKIKIRKNENLPVLPGNEPKGTKRSNRCGHPLCRQPKLTKEGEPPHKITCPFCKVCKRHKFDCINDSRCRERMAWKKGRPVYGTIWKEWYEPGQY